MASDFYYPTTKNAVQKTLSAQLLSTASTGDAITFDDVDGVGNTPGVLVINRINANGDATPESREFISYTGTAGNTVLIETRNVDGSGAARTHAVGSIVEFIADAVWAQRVIDQFKIEHNQDGTHNDVSLDSSTDFLVEHNADGTHSDITADSINLNSGGKIADNTGWIPIEETFTYASATTITIAAGGASRYQKGDKLKLTQTTVKYFYVVAVADELLTITGGTDYTLADAAITSPYLSRIENPFGFPAYFTYTPTLGGGATALGNGTITGKFTIHGSVCTTWMKFILGSTSVVGTFPSTTLPVASSTVVRRIGTAFYYDASNTTNRIMGNCMIESDNTNVLFTYSGAVGSTASYGALSASVPFTWATDDSMSLDVTYFI